MLDYHNIGTIYVSQKTGNDQYSGFYKEENGHYQGPLKSIEAALTRISHIRQSGALQPVTIKIVDDQYLVEKPIRIDESTNDITIKGNGNTLIHGGMRITGFKEDCFNGRRCFSATVPRIHDGFWFTDFFVDGMRADLTSIPKDIFFSPLRVENKEHV